MIYKMTLKDSVDTMTFNLLETPIVDKDIEGAVDNVTLDGNQYTDYLYLKKQYIQKWAIMCPDEYDELRGFYTRQFEEGEVPSYRVYYGANVTRDYTLNGDYFQFNAEGIETGMTLSQLLGNAEQTTYSGKNLLYATELPKTQSNVTATYQDGIFGLSGTSSTATNLYILPYTQSVVHLEAGESVTMYIERVSGTSKVYFTGYFEPDDASAIDYDWGLTLESGASTVKRVRTASKAGNLTHVQMFINASTTYNSTVKILVQKGNIASPTWEPYVGGTASPNPNYPQPISTVTGAQNIEVVGKNLFDKDSATQNYRLGSTGEPFADSDYYLSDYISVRQSTAYYISGVSGNAESSAVCFYASDKSFISRRAFVSDWYSFTTPVNTAFLRFTTLKTHSTDQVQLEHGSTATTFEPYHGQSYEVNLGKNLLDNKATTRTYLGVTLTKNNDGSITLNGTSTGNAQFYLDVDGVGFQGRNSHLGAGTYTINGRDSGGVKFEINYQTANGSSKYSRGTFTAAEPFDYGVYVAITNGTTVNNLRIYPQLERGSQATSYAPYFPPIELAKIGNYQDRIYKEDGKWYIEKQVGKTVITTENASSWLLNSTSYAVPMGYCSKVSLGGKTGWATGVAITNRYSEITSIPQITSGKFGTNFQQPNFIIFDSSFTDTATMRTNLVGTEIYIALATPTTTEITDETLLLQLNFLASLYEGENNISLIGTGAQGEMEVFIRDVMSVETDVVPEVPVRLTLTDDGVINACGCRRNVQLTMRETTE